MCVVPRPILRANGAESVVVQERGYERRGCFDHCLLTLQEILYPGSYWEIVGSFFRPHRIDPEGSTIYDQTLGLFVGVIDRFLVGMVAYMGG